MGSEMCIRDRTKGRSIWCTLLRWTSDLGRDVCLTRAEKEGFWCSNRFKFGCDRRASASQDTNDKKKLLANTVHDWLEMLWRFREKIRSVRSVPAAAKSRPKCSSLAKKKQGDTRIRTGTHSTFGTIFLAFCASYNACGRVVVCAG